MAIRPSSHGDRKTYPASLHVPAPGPPPAAGPVVPVARVASGAVVRPPSDPLPFGQAMAEVHCCDELAWPLAAVALPNWTFSAALISSVRTVLCPFGGTCGAAPNFWAELVLDVDRQLHGRVGDVRGDRLPDVAVGRQPALGTEDLASLRVVDQEVDDVDRDAGCLVLREHRPGTSRPGPTGPWGHPGRRSRRGCSWWSSAARAAG